MNFEGTKALIAADYCVPRTRYARRCTYFRLASSPAKLHFRFGVRCPIISILGIRRFCLRTFTVQEELMKTVRISDETFEFLAYIARQDVTLPALLVDYLKYSCYTKDEIKAHLDALNDACNETRDKERTLSK